jgi:hypothetical protein
MRPAADKDEPLGGRLCSFILNDCTLLKLAVSKEY